MTRVVVVADSGAVLADLTSAVGEVPGAYIVRYGSGRARLDLLVAQAEPDLVVIGDLLRSSEALARLTEVRIGAPDAKVVIMSSSPAASWLADALRAHASAVLPGNVRPAALALVLTEVIAAPAAIHATQTEGLARPARERRSRRRPRGTRPVAVPPREQAA